MHSRLTVGDILPRAELAKLAHGAIEIVPLQKLLQDGRSLIFGVPGAFTPVCTEHHVPDYVKNEAMLRRSGYDQLICVAPNDPFTLSAWSRLVDPENTLLFLSDGNGDLARSLGVATSYTDHFLAHSTRRYLLTTQHRMITHFAVEPTLTLLTCTRSGDLPIAA